MTTPRRWLPCLLLTALLVVPVAVRADYTCPGDGITYKTTCGPNDNHAKCIRLTAGVGCCNPGNCNASGACIIDTSSNVCPKDGNPCDKPSCDTGGAGGFDAVCGQVADPLKSGTDCSDVDGDKCTIDKCNASGVCTFDHNKVDDCNLPSTDPQCPDTKSCHSPDGACVVTYTNQGTSCNDGFDCTIGEICVNGDCKNGAVQEQGTPCADGVPLCHKGFCRGGASTNCVDSGNKDNGTACQNDTNTCTDQTCQNGTCTVTACNTAGCALCNPPFACGTSTPACGCGNQ